MDKIFFIGIGGVGMSKLALLYRDIGFKVEGSDAVDSYNARSLAEKGIPVFIGQRALHINKSIDTVIYSSAIKENNAELRKAAELHIKLLKRGEALAEVVNNYKTIVVSGTHGKTTTVSLIGHILKQCGKNVNVYVGGRDSEFDNFKKEANYFVIESDESDGSFLLFDPDMLIITNIDKDHLNHYGNSFENLKQAFLELSGKSKIRIVSMDDLSALNVGLHFPSDTYYYSNGKCKANICSRNISYGNDGVNFDILFNGKAFSVFLPMFGEKNVSNALAALLVATAVGIRLENAIESLRSFSPPARRMELKGNKKGITVIDDHADHPTEVAATLTALKAHFPGKRIIAVYQPHRYSRAFALGKDIAFPFYLPDITIVMELYAAFEKPIPGINGKVISDWIKEINPSKEVYYAPRKDDVIKIFKHILKKDDLIVLLGPGDIEELSSCMLDYL